MHNPRWLAVEDVGVCAWGCGLLGFGGTIGVVRRCAAWLVALPLMVAGSQVAHAVAYRIVYPEAQVRWQVLLSTGHAYLSYWPLLFGVVGGVLLVGVRPLWLPRCRRGPAAVPAWAFGLLPLAGFTVQEFLERWLRGRLPVAGGAAADVPDWPVVAVAVCAYCVPGSHDSCCGPWSGLCVFCARAQAPSAAWGGACLVLCV